MGWKVRATHWEPGEKNTLIIVTTVDITATVCYDRCMMKNKYECNGVTRVQWGSWECFLHHTTSHVFILTKRFYTYNCNKSMSIFRKSQLWCKKEKRTLWKKNCRELKIYFLLEPHPYLSKCALKHTEISNCPDECHKGHWYLSQAADDRLQTAKKRQY